MRGTFKVAIWFENWGPQRRLVPAPLRRHGQPTWIAEFYNYWLYARSQGLKVPLGEYCYEWLAAVKGRFALRENPRVNYAYHFDAALYARYMRRMAEKRGVKRVEGKIKQVRTREGDGFVESLELEDGQIIARGISSSTAPASRALLRSRARSRPATRIIPTG